MRHCCCCCCCLIHPRVLQPSLPLPPRAVQPRASSPHPYPYGTPTSAVPYCSALCTVLQLLQRFKLDMPRDSGGLLLKCSGFTLPPRQLLTLLRDNDVIFVAPAPATTSRQVLQSTGLVPRALAAGAVLQSTGLVPRALAAGAVLQSTGLVPRALAAVVLYFTTLHRTVLPSLPQRRRPFCGRCRHCIAPCCTAFLHHTVLVCTRARAASLCGRCGIALLHCT